VPFKDPERRRAYQRKYKAAERAGTPRLTPPSIPLLPPGLRARTAEDVRDIASRYLAAVDAAEMGLTEKVRNVAVLCTLLLKSIESGNHAARLEAVEQVLKLREAK
jgi:hypothetical protein